MKNGSKLASSAAASSRPSRRAPASRPRRCARPCRPCAGRSAACRARRRPSSRRRRARRPRPQRRPRRVPAPRRAPSARSPAPVPASLALQISETPVRPYATRMTADDIGIGMLGYAFMGKAHSRAFQEIARLDTPLQPRLVAVAGRNEDAVAAVAAQLRLRALDDRLARPRRRPGDRPVRQRRPQLAARRADDRRGRGGQARPLREAARPRRGRELRDLAARRGDRRQAPVRLQLPLRAGGAAGARADRGRRARRDPPLPRPLPPGLGRRPDPRHVALPARRGGIGRARRPRHARRRPRALPRRRDLDRRRLRPHLPARTGRSTTRSRRPSVRERRDRDDRGDAARARPAQRLPVGDQRLEGLARVRHGAPERAAGLPGRRRPRAGLQDGARLRGRPSVLGALVAARATSSAGARPSRTRRSTSCARSRRTRTSLRTPRRSRTATGRQRCATRSSARARPAAASP